MDTPIFIYDRMGRGSSAGNWYTYDIYPRMSGDLNGDGKNIYAFNINIKRIFFFLI